MLALFQMASVLTLIWAFLVHKKIPTKTNILGSLLVIGGIAFYIHGNYSTKNEKENSTNKFGVLFGVVTIILTSIYNYAQETTFDDYKLSCTTILGIMGIYISILGIIPVATVNMVGVEEIGKITTKCGILIICTGFVSVFGEWLVVFAIRNSSAFVMSTILAFQAPLGLAYEIIENKINKTSTHWCYWYIPAVILIVIGGIIAGMNNNTADIKSSDTTNSIVRTNGPDTDNSTSLPMKFRQASLDAGAKLRAIHV